MTTTTIKLRNDFHGSGATVRATLNDRDEWTLSPRQVANARRRLCGVKTCTCSGPVGTRGKQIQDSGDVADLIENVDGSYTVELRGDFADIQARSDATEDRLASMGFFG